MLCVKKHHTNSTTFQIIFGEKKYEKCLKKYFIQVYTFFRILFNNDA